MSLDNLQLIQEKFSSCHYILSLVYWTMFEAMDQNHSGFLYLKQKLSRISEVRSITGIYIGLQIRGVMRDAM
jgi:hypothetical protein